MSCFDDQPRKEVRPFQQVSTIQRQPDNIRKNFSSTYINNTYNLIKPAISVNMTNSEAKKKEDAEEREDTLGATTAELLRFTDENLIGAEIDYPVEKLRWASCLIPRELQVKKPHNTDNDKEKK